MASLLALLFAAGSLLAHDAAAAAPTPITAQWRADLRYLATELPKRHVAPFWRLSRQQFEREVTDLDRRLPALDPDQIFVGMDRIENAIGDGHTYIRIPKDAPTFPLRFFRFGTDYRLIAAPPGSAPAAMLGARLVKVGDTPIAEAQRQLLSLTPAGETQPLRDVRATNLLVNGLILHGLRLITDRAVARYTLQADDGTRREIRLPAGPAPTTWHELPAAPPLSLQHPDLALACTELPAQQAMYCNFRSYRTLATDAPRMLAQIDRAHPQRLIVDFRRNDGGDFCLGLKYLVDPIRARPAINQDGHLFVLIGPRSFSAAMANAVHFRQLTHAILVGDPIGEKPNSYQEAREMVLPHSKWVARYSTRLYRFTAGAENLIRPDVAIPTPWQDYRAGKDPPLDWTLNVPIDAHLKPRAWPGLGKTPAGSEICEGDY
ncbi:S41 family peptidase [Frateuria terrea]|uniref:S41 family peptidase n=1 Tax=Frateuria terrea TaxID=529704 RepID=UPI000B8A220A|nr:S41 family peptidase [Frateuria terrea]